MVMEKHEIDDNIVIFSTRSQNKVFVKYHTSSADRN